MRNWILVKGMKQDQRHWLGVPERFARRFGGRVVCLDLPGVGSEVDREAPATVDGLVDDLRDRFHRVAGEDGPWGLLGLSLGGMVALSWAARHPEDLAGVVVGNTSARDLSGPLRRIRPGALGALAGAFTARDPVRRERLVLDVVVTSLRRDRGTLAGRFAGFHAERPFRRAVLAQQVRAGASFRSPRRIALPMLVLVGGGDRLVDPRCSEALAARYAATVARHPRAGHDLGLDDPEWLVNTVHAWTIAGR